MGRRAGAEEERSVPALLEDRLFAVKAVGAGTTRRKIVVAASFRI